MKTTLNIPRTHCTELGWKYKDAGEFIVIGFDVENLLKPIYIKQKNETTKGTPIIEISYFAGDVSEDEGERSHINTLLLRRNEKLIFGHWVIKTIVGYDNYEFKYNIDINQFTIDVFVEIIGICIEEIKFLMSIKSSSKEK